MTSSERTSIPWGAFVSPLGAHTILGGAIGYIRANPGFIVGVGVAGTALNQTLGLFAPRISDDPVWGFVARLSGELAALVVYAVLAGLLLGVLRESLVRHRVRAGEVWSAVAARLPGLVVLLLVQGLVFGVLGAAAGGLLVVAATRTRHVTPVLVLSTMAIGIGLVVVWLVVRWSLTAPVYLFERVGVWTALARSWALVRGASWRVWGILLLATVGGLGAAVFLSLPFGGASVLVAAVPPESVPVGEQIPRAIALTVAGTFAMPFAAGVSGLLYIDQRLRRARIDHEQLPGVTPSSEKGAAPSPTTVVAVWPFLLTAALMALTIVLPLVHVEEWTAWVVGPATWPIGAAAVLALITCGVWAVRAGLRRAAHEHRVARWWYGLVAVACAFLTALLGADIATLTEVVTRPGSVAFAAGSAVQLWGGVALWRALTGRQGAGSVPTAPHPAVTATVAVVAAVGLLAGATTVLPRPLSAYVADPDVALHPVEKQLTSSFSRGDTLATALVDGRPVVISSGSWVTVWDLATGDLVGDPFSLDTTAVRMVATAHLDGRPVGVAISMRTVQVWDLTTGATVVEYTAEDIGYKVAVAQLDGRPVLVSPRGDDDTIRVWDLATGAPVHQHPAGITDLVTAVTAAQLDGRPVVVSGSTDGTVQVWDLATGTPVGRPLTGHTDGVQAVTTARLDDRTVIISGSADDTVRVWDLATGAPIGRPLTGHTGWVETVTTARLDDRTVIISGSTDDTMRVWDLATGSPVGQPIAGAPFPSSTISSVQAVATAQLDGRTIVIAGIPGETIKVWDLDARVLM